MGGRSATTGSLSWGAAIRTRPTAPGSRTHRKVRLVYFGRDELFASLMFDEPASEADPCDCLQRGGEAEILVLALGVFSRAYSPTPSGNTIGR